MSLAAAKLHTFGRRAMGLVMRFRYLLTFLLHLVLVTLSSYIAIWLRFDGAIDEVNWIAWRVALPALLLVRTLALWWFRMYEGLWRYTSLWDLRNIVSAVGLSSVMFYAITRIFGLGAYPRSVIIMDSVLLICMISAARLSRRVVEEIRPVGSGRRVLIYGAGDAGEAIVRHIKKGMVANYLPIGFIDDDRAKLGRRIHGVPVLGGRDALSSLMKQHRPDEILLALPQASATVIRSIVKSLESTQIPIKTLPSLRDIIDGKVQLTQIRDLSVEDLLARAPVGLDPGPLKALIRGRRILVTGAGGSIGSELCRQIAKLGPACLVLFERYENTLQTLSLELGEEHPNLDLRVVVADVADDRRVAEVLRDTRPSIIFHAAAHKHVPLMELNPCEAIKNNVRGTRVLASAASQYGVGRFVLISTDKAVNPTSVMGASKRAAELIVQLESRSSRTVFSCVRFGNVLASNGSVVPRFVKQIKHGGPITVTHPEMKRFFMLIPEAVQLVLHTAAMSECGATYVLEMGEQVKLVDLARDMIRLSGLIPDEDIKIQFTGVRPGEKLYEELVGPAEVTAPSSLPKILRVVSERALPPKLAEQVQMLEMAAESGQTKAVLDGLARISEFTNPATEDVSLDSPPQIDPQLLDSRAAVWGGKCPNCGGDRVYRSRAKSIPERIRKDFANSPKRLFSCKDCQWRGWLVPLEPVASSATSLGASSALDLREVDDTLLQSDRPLNRGK